MPESFELIEREATSMLDVAREITVTCDEEYELAGNFVLGCKQLVAKIKAEFSEPKRKADEAHKAITAMEKRTLEPVQQALDVASGVALAWKGEQDRLAKEEADRVESERRRQEEEKRLAEAERLDAEGKFEEAEAILDEPIRTPRMTKFITPVPKVAGLSTKKKWKGRILDHHYVSRPYCKADQTMINDEVGRFFSYNPKPSQEQIDDLILKLGGPKAVEIYEEEIFAGRRA